MVSARKAMSAVDAMVRVRDKDEAHGTFCAPFSLQESSRPLVELLPLLT